MSEVRTMQQTTHKKTIVLLIKDNQTNSHDHRKHWSRYEDTEGDDNGVWWQGLVPYSRCRDNRTPAPGSECSPDCSAL